MGLKGNGRRARGRLAASGAALALLLVGPAAAMVPTPREKPLRVAQTESVTQAGAVATDRDRLNQILLAVQKKDYGRAVTLAELIEAPGAKSLGRWLWLYYADDSPLVTASAAGAFIDRHAGWPALQRIQANAERAMTDQLAPASVLAFFRARDPVTGEGRLQLARAQFATGERAAGELQIREAWRTGSFKLADEQKILSVYGATLTTEDHIARADRLLWAREPVSARRVFSRLPESERRMAEARAALLSGEPNGPGLFDVLPAAERADPGVLHAAIRYFRRHENEPRAVELTRLLPTDPAKLRQPARLWEERQLLMRWALTERRYPDAYSLAANAALEAGSEFAEAEFNAGWIALRFLNAPARAETHFTALAGGVAAPISKSRAFYWLGRAAAAKGDAALAERRFKQAAEFPFTYYGQLASERLGAAGSKAAFPPAPQTTAEDRAKFAARPAAGALSLLADLPDADGAFLVFAYYLDDHLETPGEFLELKRVAERRGAMHAVVRAGKVGVGKGVAAYELSYPLIDVPDAATRFAPKEMILGLSRQESEFNPRAFSPAGARGLMQLLPGTAQITARKEGLKYERAALLNDPRQNLILGAAHLSHLLERYGGSYAMTFAAYNAGPNRVEEWMSRYGDPRGPGVDPVDWVEQIPFQETRNYVQRVLENTQVYRGRLNKAPIAGRLVADLERGGPKSRAGMLAALSGGALPPAPQRTFDLASLATIDAPTDAPTVRPKPQTDAPSQPLPAGSPVPADAPKPAQTPTPAPTPAPSAAPGPNMMATPDAPAIKPQLKPRPRRAPPPDPNDSAAAGLNARALEAARATDLAEPEAAKTCPPPEVSSDGGGSDDEDGLRAGASPPNC